MKTTVAIVVMISVIAVANCQAGTPQCIFDFYANNPDVATAVAENCAFLTTQVQ